MQRGDILSLRAYPDKIIERVLWEVHPTWVMVCRPEIYEEAIRKRRKEPLSFMGFPIEDVITLAQTSSAFPAPISE